MQIKGHSCVKINSSTEPAHGNTEASVSGHRLDSGTRKMTFEMFASNISTLHDRTHPWKKDKKLYLRVLFIQDAEWFLFFTLVTPDVVSRGFLLDLLFAHKFKNCL